MSEYFPGDVVLATLRISHNGDMKTRPGVVIGADKNGFVTLCPVTSSVPQNSPYIALELDDFEKGGLSLFEESYILTSHATNIRNNEILGKKGRLKAEKISAISSGVSPN